MKVKSESEVAQSCPTLSDPMDCSPPGSSIHGIFQARVLEWGAIAFSANQTNGLKKKKKKNQKTGLSKQEEAREKSQKISLDIICISALLSLQSAAPKSAADFGFTSLHKDMSQSISINQSLSLFLSVSVFHCLSQSLPVKFHRQ